jgi:hypothetical protein
MDKPLEIYNANITFRRAKKGLRVIVQVGYRRKQRQKREKLPFPENINKKYLFWGRSKRHRGEWVAFYERKGSLEYYGLDNSRVPIDFAQRLEALVLQVHSKNSK